MASEPLHTDGLSNGALASVEAALGYSFSDGDLPLQALTHGSYAAENQGIASYERLEFLGDAVLQLVATQMIFELLPDVTEGRMTDVRQHVVNQSTLAQVARRMALGGYVRLSKGALMNGDADRESVLSDVVEALLGAVFLDGGYVAGSAVVRQHFDEPVRSAAGMEALDDDRSRLVKYAARRGLALRFDYEQFGPIHTAEFKASAVMDDEIVGVAVGTSKKRAAAAASTAAIATLGLTRDR